MVLVGSPKVTRTKSNPRNYVFDPKSHFLGCFLNYFEVFAVWGVPGGHQDKNTELRAGFQDVQKETRPLNIVEIKRQIWTSECW